MKKIISFLFALVLINLSVMGSNCFSQENEILPAHIDDDADMGIEGRDFTQAAQEGSILPAEVVVDKVKETQASDHGKVVAQAKPSYTQANNTICPVSKHHLDQSDYVEYVYKDLIYNLCSKECLIEFKKNPEQYISQFSALEVKAELEVDDTGLTLDDSKISHLIDEEQDVDEE